MPRIIVDTRESGCVTEALKELGCDVIEKMLAPADYILTEGFAVERKTFRDFLKSVYDKTIFEQARRMSETYEGSCLVVEGDFSWGF